MEKKTPDLVIVYDKYTEEMANGISGKLAGTYTCLVQSDKVFESKKYEYSNNNRILFLAEDLIWSYLKMGKMTEYTVEKKWGKGKCTVYFDLYSLGNWRGIYIDGGKTARSQSTIETIFYYTGKYYADYLLYPFKFKKDSKVDDFLLYSEDVVKFFCKKENLKLIIPD